MGIRGMLQRSPVVVNPAEFRSTIEQPARWPTTDFRSDRQDDDRDA
jgi:hypothetical protein